MTDPTTPTGKRHYDRVQRVGYAWFKGEDIIAIEQEAAAAERERLEAWISHNHVPAAEDGYPMPCPGERDATNCDCGLTAALADPEAPSDE